MGNKDSLAEQTRRQVRGAFRATEDGRKKRHAERLKNKNKGTKIK